MEILVKETEYPDLEKKAKQLMEDDGVLYASIEIPMEFENNADENPWEAGEHKKKNNDHDESNPSGNDWWAEAIGAFSAWDYVDSNELALADVAVGVVDNGVDTEHEEFQHNGSSKIQWLEDYRANTPRDHGTHVSGLIGAENNQVGIRGVADKADLYFVSWRDENLLSTGNYVNVTKQMIEEMMENHTACVVNNSWGKHLLTEEEYMKEAMWGGGNILENTKNLFLSKFWGVDKKFQLYESYLKWQDARARSGAGADIAMIVELLMNQQERFLIVQAAGNGYNNWMEEGYDAAKAGDYCSITEEFYDEMDGEKHRLSKRGYSYETIKNHILIVGAAQKSLNGYKMHKGSNYGENVDLAAPGYEVYSLITEKDDKEEKNEHIVKNQIVYDQMSGTSMAAPLVSGSAAVLWSVAPELSAEEVKDVLISTAGTAAVANKKDTRSGYPMLNLKAAIEKVTENDADHVTLENHYIKQDEDSNDLFTSENEQYAVITGLDKNENVVWTIETGKSPATEVPSTMEIGIHEGRYYYEHDGIIYAIRLRDGEEIWHSASSHGAITGSDFGTDGTLYYCSFYGPDFGAIDKDGNELAEIESFYPEYYWASELRYRGDYVDVNMGNSEFGDGTVIRVNLSDYSYSVVKS